MEPGHEDREYPGISSAVFSSVRPQWSPAMKTGNTTARAVHSAPAAVPQWSPAMKTGNTRPHARRPSRPSRLNGARP